MGAIGGKEKVGGGAVLDLLGERGGGAEGGDEGYAGLGLVLTGELGEYRLEIGGGGDVERRFWGCGLGWGLGWRGICEGTAEK